MVKILSIIAVSVLLLSCVFAQENYQEVQYSDAPRFREQQAVRFIRPVVNTPPQQSNSLVPTPSTPEPAAAAEPRRSLVEEVTGLSEQEDNIHEAAAHMRFREAATASAAASAPAEYHTATNDDDGSDDKDKQLQDALQNVKDQIVAKASQIKSEKKWVKEVTKIIETYVQKTRRVNANIRSLQKDVKGLFRKKKQIENLVLQRRLQDKLKIASKDLNTLESALKNVKTKEDAFTKSKHDISETIAAVQEELSKLRGSNTTSSS